MKKIYKSFIVFISMINILNAGTIERDIWVPININTITTFIPYHQSLPDRDNDGIEDSVDTPIAQAQSLTIDANSNGYAIVLQGYDNDNDISYIVVTKPLHGTLSGNVPNLIYIPDNGYEGNDRFTFKVNDGAHESQVVTVYIHVIKSGYAVQSESEASSFLSRATFGSRQEEIDALINLGDYEKWIDLQMESAPTEHLKWINKNLKGINGTYDLNTSLENWKAHSDTLSYTQRDAWWYITTNAMDQLRQRVAFALSEILVISKNGPLLTYPDARVSYYDVLVRNAFGNFEDLLKEVSYHPAMGKYLSYLGNPKANPETGSHPDENYAREVMQLFTVGLYKLNLDSSKKLIHGKTIPTYSQNDIKEMARIFTGLSDNNAQFPAEAAFSSYKSRTQAMQAFESQHDMGSKTVLGQIIHAGSTKGDIDGALHMLFIHENTAPFISKQLIQRLVTSNPSPEYVARVASIFKNNGKEISGDLSAVVKAILLDDEALRVEEHPENFGKFREPLLYFTHLFRAFHAKGKKDNRIQVDNGPTYQYESFNFNGTGMMKQEGALEALTVFNYFAPDDTPYALGKQGLVAPELMLYGKKGIDDVLMGVINKNGFIYDTYSLTIDLDLSKEIAFINQKDFVGLLEHLDILLTGKQMSQKSKNIMINYLKNVKLNHNGNPITSEELARYAIALVITSPAYALQK